jgi:hypothetical protein
VKNLRRLAIVLAALVVAIQLVPVERTNPLSDPARSLASIEPMTPAAAAIWDRACRDCHSHDTRWPWYAHVAPVSWYVIEHVNHARSHMNVSNWAAYDAGRADKLLSTMCAYARERQMPLPSYLKMHDEAILTHDDIEALCAWTAAATTPRP